MGKKMIPTARQREIHVDIATSLRNAVEAEGYEVDNSEMLMHQSHLDMCQMCNWQMGMVSDQTILVQDFITKLSEIGIVAPDTEEEGDDGGDS